MAMEALHGDSALSNCNPPEALSKRQYFALEEEFWRPEKVAETQNQSRVKYTIRLTPLILSPSTFDLTRRRPVRVISRHSD
jgi:hypothetical protein